MYQSLALQISRSVSAPILLLASVAHAQVVDTNRPGFSFTPGIVPEGRWQLETGGTYFELRRDTHLTALPLAELRFGLADDVEIFLSSISWAEIESGNNRGSGLLDPILGTKIAISDGKAKTALVFQLSLPVGDSDFSSDEFDPAAAFVWTYDGRIPLAGTVSVAHSFDRFVLGNGLKLPFAINDRQSAFVEWEALLSEGGTDAHWLNGGFQWLLDDRQQIDINAGAGLNDEAGDYRIGAGFAVLF